MAVTAAQPLESCKEVLLAVLVGLLLLFRQLQSVWELERCVMKLTTAQASKVEVFVVIVQEQVFGNVTSQRTARVLSALLDQRGEQDRMKE